MISSMLKIRLLWSLESLFSALKGFLLNRFFVGRQESNPWRRDRVKQISKLVSFLKILARISFSSSGAAEHRG